MALYVGDGGVPDPPAANIQGQPQGGGGGAPVPIAANIQGQPQGGGDGAPVAAAVNIQEQPQGGGGGAPVPPAPVKISSKKLLFNVVGAVLFSISIVLYKKKSFAHLKPNNRVFIGFCCVLGGLVIDGFALLLIKTGFRTRLPNNQYIIHLGFVRDIIDVASLALGLYIQQKINPSCGLYCLLILASIFWLFMSFILITEPPSILGMADFVIGISSTLMVFLAKNKIGHAGVGVGGHIALLIMTGLFIISALLVRNHYEQVQGGNLHPVTTFGWISNKATTIWNHFRQNQEVNDAGNDNNAGNGEAQIEPEEIA